MSEFNEIIGKTLKEIDINESKDEIKFICSDGTVYVMYHNQDIINEIKEAKEE